MSAEIDTPYCKICESCGHSGCCPATICHFKKGGKYCDFYLEELRTTYNLNSELLKVLYEDKDKYPELIRFWENICDNYE